LSTKIKKIIPFIIKRPVSNGFFKEFHRIWSEFDTNLTVLSVFNAISGPQNSIALTISRHFFQNGA
jgi:hypothetical protein